jgi:hypothetical protein
VITELFDQKVRVVTPEYLILLKLLPLSGQDIVDIKALVKVADMDRVRALAFPGIKVRRDAYSEPQIMGDVVAIVAFR